MDLHRKSFCIVILILSSNTKICLYGAPAEGSVINKELIGQELIKMGNLLNKPLISLLGAKLVKIEQKVNKELSERIEVTEKKLQGGIDKLTMDASQELQVAEKKLQGGIDKLTSDASKKLQVAEKKLQGGIDKLKLDASKELQVAEEKLQSGIDKLTLDASKEREILKMELCKQTICATWTEWSRCSTQTTETFGARTRSRKCGGNSSICLTNSADTVETDYQICQRKAICKHILTKNNYCIKLYKNVRKSLKDAKNDCHKDGGYLINIDSALKARDVSDYFKNISFPSFVWIDGTRTLPNGEWKYDYGSKDTIFSMWSSSEPEGKDDCKVFGSHSGKWHGVSCSHYTWNYLCEIV